LGARTTHGLFDALRAAEPVHWVPGEWGTLDSGGHWAVVSHAGVLEVGRDQETVTSSRAAAYPTFPEEAAGFGQNLMTQDDPQHARLRLLPGARSARGSSTASTSGCVE
jgi:cytochrome P450